MKIMITTTTKDTHKRLSTNSENGSFQNRPHLIRDQLGTVPEKRGWQWLNPFSKLTKYGTMQVKGVDKIPLKKRRSR